MNRTDKIFTIGIFGIFFAALSAAVSVRANINPVVFMSSITAFGIIAGVMVTGFFKSRKLPSEEELKEGTPKWETEMKNRPAPKVITGYYIHRPNRKQHIYFSPKERSIVVEKRKDANKRAK